MTNTIKRWIASGLRAGVAITAKAPGGRYLLEQVLNRAMNRSESIRHQGTDLTFAVPNSLTRFRVSTFSTKEPETLEWIDGISAASVVWDVGANVGLYSCYAAKARGCRVIAFEPSIFNLELLARNISLNRLTGRITVVPLPLSEALSVGTLNLSTTEWGGALSSFGQDYGHDGRPLHAVFRYPTIGLSMSHAVDQLGIPLPDYIKMDVDGIEHLILKGGAAVLKNVKGMLIEINEEFEKQATESARYLSEAGLVLHAKRHAEMFDDSALRYVYNQIWRRPTQPDPCQ
jgi:FkbM family methyltransferase